MTTSVASLSYASVAMVAVLSLASTNAVAREARADTHPLLHAGTDSRSVPAFPGAEGAGRLALGGRGGRVLRVTTLADAGPGSLRAAVEAEGPRTIIFDIGGTIRLASPLTVRRGLVTVAGQTAPGGGITLRDHPLVIAADDVVVRYVRSRLGDESGVEADAVSITRGRRIILDHISASWSVDETLSVGSRYDPPERGIYDVTVQWSLIAESLNASGHDKGDHGYGSLVRGGHGARMTFYHNLWASHRARMPRPGNYNRPAVDPRGPLFEFRSNVFYNWGAGHAGYNADTESLSAYAFIGNAYLTGPNSTGAIAFEEDNPLARAWFENNAMNGAVPADPWSLIKGADRPGYRLQARPDWAEAVAATPDQTLAAVLERAGASKMRDGVDQRVIAGVSDRSGRIIDSQAEVGGWPDLSPGIAWADRDGDGMPDDWETAHGLDPADPSDGATDVNADGYTHLEDWLNSLA
ncbi:pectate lyase family protein [Brevundimonas variabilis]|uniref:Pectate lyase n=1 Tax=Brevundimonas variabilis TaxID=74312 RepID=A0A7W9CL12_9CAUL|nr:pectate lyase [Brevundimonas variabilis]MBB5747378.1 pectate lyase [Brevundimonas variabilis]